MDAESSSEEDVFEVGAHDTGKGSRWYKPVWQQREEEAEERARAAIPSHKDTGETLYFGRDNTPISKGKYDREVRGDFGGSERLVELSNRIESERKMLEEASTPHSSTKSTSMSFYSPTIPKDFEANEAGSDLKNIGRYVRDRTHFVPLDLNKDTGALFEESEIKEKSRNVTSEKGINIGLFNKVSFK